MELQIKHTNSSKNPNTPKIQLKNNLCTHLLQIQLVS